MDACGFRELARALALDKAQGKSLRSARSPVAPEDDEVERVDGNDLAGHGIPVSHLSDMQAGIV